MSVITHVKKSGNSFALHLPKSFVLAHHLDGDADPAPIGYRVAA